MYCVRTLFPTKLESKTDNGPSLLCLCCGFPPPGLDLSTSNLAGALTIELRRVTIDTINQYYPSYQVSIYLIIIIIIMSVISLSTSVDLD
jgi:hypothetical protein